MAKPELTEDVLTLLAERERATAAVHQQEEAVQAESDAWDQVDDRDKRLQQASHDSRTFLAQMNLSGARSSQAALDQTLADLGFQPDGTPIRRWRPKRKPSNVAKVLNSNWVVGVGSGVVSGVILLFVGIWIGQSS